MSWREGQPNAKFEREIHDEREIRDEREMLS
jgi:hypothetical protein